MSSSKLASSTAWSIIFALTSTVPCFAQGISEMGAANAMSAGLGAGMHRNIGGATNGLNNAFGSINKQLGGASSGTSGSTSTSAYAFPTTNALGEPIDPHITVRSAGKESNRLFDLAVQKQKAGKNAEAEQLYRRSLIIREQIWGDKDPAVPKLMSVLGDLMRKRGALADAEKCYRNVLAADLKRYGVGTYELVPTLEKLGQICFEQKKYTDAYNFFQQVHTQRSRKLGVDNVETITAALELSNAYYESGNLNEAADLLSKTIDAKLNDSGSPQMVKLLSAYMTVLKKQNKQEELTRVETRLQSMKPAPPAVVETNSETTKVETAKTEETKTEAAKTGETKVTQSTVVSKPTGDPVKSAEVKTESKN